jgi:transposase
VVCSSCVARFPQNRAGLRALERWAKRFPERRWALENSGGLGRYLAGRLAAAGESVVDVPPKLSARVRVLSSFAGNARKNDGLDALASAFAQRRLTKRSREASRTKLGELAFHAIGCIRVPGAVSYAPGDPSRLRRTR